MTGDIAGRTLRDLLASSYNELKRRLARRLGSFDAAGDVLHETYLRVERFDRLELVENPQAYLFRMALNAASDYERARNRLLTAVEIEDIWRLGEETIDPERIVAGQREVALFKEVLNELSPRCREILIAARVDELPHGVIAERFGISTRMVQHELRHALEYCAARLERKIVRRFGPAAAKR